MHLERLPKFDSDSYGYADSTGSHDYHLLICPECKGNYLHHIKVESGPKSYVGYSPSDQGATTEDFINIYFYCEFCGEGRDEETFLHIEQHKGQTIVEWKRKK